MHVVHACHTANTCVWYVFHTCACACATDPTCSTSSSTYEAGKSPAQARSHRYNLYRPRTRHGRRSEMGCQHRATRTHTRHAHAHALCHTIAVSYAPLQAVRVCTGTITAVCAHVFVPGGGSVPSCVHDYEPSSPVAMFWPQHHPLADVCVMTTRSPGTRLSSCSALLPLNSVVAMAFT